MRLDSSWRKATAEAAEEMGAGAAPWPPGSGRDGGRRGGRTSRSWSLLAPPPPFHNVDRIRDKNDDHRSLKMKVVVVENINPQHLEKWRQTGLRFARALGLPTSMLGNRYLFLPYDGSSFGRKSDFSSLAQIQDPLAEQVSAALCFGVD